MNLDAILRVDVIDPGDGYAVLPQIIIDPSITVTFTSADVNLLSNTISLPSPLLQTGDLIKYTIGTNTTAVGGLDVDQYYYVNVLETTPTFVVGLYTTYRDAINDSDRVVLFDTGSGVNNALNVSARASCVSTSLPIRENQITLRFDRTTYNSELTDWVGGAFYGSFYAGLYNNSERISSSSIGLQSTQPDIDNILASAQGAVFEIENVTNVEVLNWSSRTRIVSAINTSTNIITITASEGGASLINSDILTNPTIGFYIGMPIKFVGAVAGNLTVETTYYIKSLVDGDKFTLSATIVDGVPQTVLSMAATYIGSAGLTGYVGELTNTAVVTIFYPGILTATATTSTTNSITVPLTGSGLGGTNGFYTNLPVFFIGDVFGGVIENERYYVTTVIDNQRFTMSTAEDPVMVSVTSTTASTDYITCDDATGLSFNDPIIFNNMSISGSAVSTFGNIADGTIYYVSAIINDTNFQISTVPNGGTFGLADQAAGTGTGCTGTDQKDIVQLTTATGSMTCNVGLPVSPGQVTGQQFTFYPTSTSTVTNPAYTQGNLITRTIKSALADGDYLSLESETGGILNVYVNMPFRLTASYGGLSTGTTYWVADTGTVTTEVIQTTSANVLISTGTAGFYVNMPITFTGSTLGGTIENTLYFVKTVDVNGTDFTISESLGGTTLALFNDTGSMTATGAPYIKVSATLGGAVLPLSNASTSTTLTQYPTVSPEFDVNWVLGGYSVEIIDGGEGYAINNTFTVLGANLTGATPANNLVMTVNTIGTNGEITSLINSGTPPEIVEQYYLKVISATECEVYSDSLLQIPVSGINFPFTAGDYALLPEPFYFNQSIVKYNNRVYQCIVSNNDTEFIFGKWELLSSGSRKLNALDRIMGYYQPTINMPGLDLTQLVDGIIYPNSTYKDNAFPPSEEYTLDTILQDQLFSPTQVDVTSIVWDGSKYFAPANTPTYSDITNSTDGATWVSNKLSNQPIGLSDIVYADGKYVVSSQNNVTSILVSDDGIVWTTAGLASGTVSIDNTSLNSIAYFNGVFVAVGDNIVSSTDAYTWFERYQFTSVILYGVSAISINNFDGLIAVGVGPDYSVIPTVTQSVILKSLDGITWVNITPSASAETLYGVSSGNNTIVVVGNNGTIFTSINGSNWNDISTGSINLRDIVYSFSLSLFVIVGENGFIATSDGSTWSIETSGTTENLNSVIWNSDLNEFIVTGNNNVILKSTNGIDWAISNIFITDPTIYDVQGDAFTSGYGPEELVPGVVSDNLTMIVTTRPGTDWPVATYQHVGYNVVATTITPSTNEQVIFGFDRLVLIPAQISVFQIDGTTGVATRLYDNDSFTVDWLIKTITLTTALPIGDSLMIEVYEVGNGDQLEKSNSQTDPIRINDVTGFNEIYLNCNYSATRTSGSGVIIPGTSPVNVIASETDSTENSILCDEVRYFTINDQITFYGDVFGGIVADTHYYVKTVSNVTNKITISETNPGGVAGPTFVLTSDTGSMDIIIETGSGAPWTDPIVYHNGTKLILGHTNRVTQTSIATNSITCNTTSGMEVGETIVFSDTIFGGVISPQTIYYIESIVDANEFTISETLGGAVLALTNAVGGAIGVTNDYAFGIADNGISAKIIFAAQYDDTLDYLSYTVFGETFPDQYGYTIPEVQIIESDGSIGPFTLTNYIGGDNPLNAVVEINGVRILDTEYTIDDITNTLTFGTGPTIGDTIAVTSYNLTERQDFNTQYDITGATVSSIVNINNEITQPIATIYITATTSGTNLIKCNDASGLIVDQTVIFEGVQFDSSIEVDGTVYYIKSIAGATTFTISATLGGSTLVLAGGTGNMLAYVGGQPAVRVTTATPHGLSSPTAGDQLVRIDGTLGSIQLNNNTYYVHVINDTEIDLYNTPYLSGLTDVNDPVTSISSYTSGGYVWLDETFVVDSVWEQNNVDRLWVTINGYRVPASSLYLNSDNNLSILVSIDPSTDSVTITSMISSATPNQLVYLQNVNKNGVGTVYRSNTDTRTWLVNPLYYIDETIYVSDVTRITDTLVQNVVAPAAIAGIISIGLDADKNTISQVIIYNATTGGYVNSSNYTIQIIELSPILQITDEVSEGDNLVITTIEGNLIYINGEQIRFTTVDLVNNTITGLQRGSNGTGIIDFIPKYSEVYGILSNNLLPSVNYNLTWNSNVYNVTDGDPLQISETNAAYFLNSGVS
jgi:hypothetical protein